MLAHRDGTQLNTLN